VAWRRCARSNAAAAPRRSHELVMFTSRSHRFGIGVWQPLLSGTSTQPSRPLQRQRRSPLSIAVSLQLRGHSLRTLPKLLPCLSSCISSRVFLEREGIPIGSLPASRPPPGTLHHYASVSPGALLMPTKMHLCAHELILSIENTPWPRKQIDTVLPSHLRRPPRTVNSVPAASSCNSTSDRTRPREPSCRHARCEVAPTP